MMRMNSWKKEGIVYEIYVQSFNDSNNDGIGDIRGIIQKLDYLKDLGVNILWLTPIFESPLVDNGYDIADYRKINPQYGTMDDVDEMIEKAHEKGLKIVMDLVVNHTSDKHEWFEKSKQSRDNEYSDYYIWRDPKEDGSAPTNHGSAFGGSAWEYCPERKQYYLHLFAKEQPDLNWDNEQMRKAIYDTMRFWTEKGIDGFRMDSISFISKPKEFSDAPVVENKEYGAYYYGISNGRNIHKYLHEMYEQVLSKYDLITIGETPHTDVEEGEKYVDPSREELDMVFQFEHMHVDYGEYGRYSDVSFKLSDLRHDLDQWQKGLSWNSNYLGNHDQPRIVSRFGDDRKYREKSAEMLAMLIMFQRGTPFIYQGDEIGMTNVDFKSINEMRDLEAYNTYERFMKLGISKERALTMVNRKTRDNGRTPMQWNSKQNAGFSNAESWIEVNPNYKEINVEKDLENKDSIYRFYQKAIDLRKSNEILIDGAYALIAADDSDIIAFVRESGNQKILVICSFADKKIKFNNPFKGKGGKLLLSNYETAKPELNDVIYLQPYEGRAYIVG